MATQKMNIGPVPYDEACAQLGSTPDFAEVARAECHAYRAALIAHYGCPPEGAELRIIGSPHDFGTYYEVYVVYDAEIDTALDYALIVEQGLARWEDAGFPAPFTYGARASTVERHFESLTQLVAAVIAGLDAAGAEKGEGRERLAQTWPDAAAIAASPVNTTD
ncbi:hypothetical protein D2V17_11470 [Aurantiacibacter xanthus]|jgi:hypothetical protein|uniref:Uncharacterized protein n=1 Tax=Aurantiacibacter xanthus TaxID=1784712 RepID=A0A3A1P3M0_9SPHN|nr:MULTISPECIES: hypothetical protein [Sphingomonadales]RIV84880.1 hypothetical protein D2V17_11470 [Aurantiacibacter xanthus]|tara:strand:+ start:849 stop:1340 length:492 start_codon:yes stop_codon:yes gene_type:complete